MTDTDLPADSAVDPQHTTQVLLQRIRNGDDAAREVLLRRVIPLFERWARGRLPDHARGAVETADLVQMTLISALRGVERFESAHPGAFFAYLRTILLNAVRKTIGREMVPGRRVIVEDVDEELVDGGSTLEALVGRENLIAYEQALRSLSPVHQSLVVMRFELGMSFVEIAAEFDESVDGVRVKLNRAIKKMVATLDGGNEA